MKTLFAILSPLLIVTLIPQALAYHQGHGGTAATTPADPTIFWVIGGIVVGSIVVVIAINIISAKLAKKKK